MASITGLITVFLLVVLNGIFVAIEFALARVNKTRIEQKAKENDKTAILILKALNNIESYISASQIGITIASLVLGAFAELSIAELLKPVIAGITSEEITALAVHSIALPLALLIVTYFHVVIGEIIPKTIAFKDPEKTCFLLIWPTEIFKLITSPLVSFLNISAAGILRLFGITDLRTTFVYTEEELKMLLNISQEEGVLEETEKEMITNIFDFPDTVAREVMTPRTDMICVDGNKTVENIIEKIIDSKHSRIPIYDGSIDNIIGVITTRDLLEQIHQGNIHKKAREVAKPVIMAPESKPLDELLTELKRKSLQMAIIVGEFGGTSGLVTVEDIVEEIVGEIPDEYDENEEPIKVMPNGEVVIDGKLNLEEINEKLGTNFSNEHYDTIGGYVFGLIGQEPKKGDQVEDSGFLFIVEEKERQRVKRIRLKPLPKNNDTSNNNSKSKEAKKRKKENSNISIKN